MEYFTADLHYGHDNIRKLCERPFGTIEEMDLEILQNLEELKPKDTLYILGDLAWWKNKEYDFRLRQLRAHIPCNKCVCILGNHDKEKNIREAGFETYHYLELKYRDCGTKRDIILCHYPLESWNKKTYGSVHLHGHTHNQTPSIGKRRLDVGVDSIGYRPWSIQEVIDQAVLNGGGEFERYP